MQPDSALHIVRNDLSQIDWHAEAPLCWGIKPVFCFGLDSLGVATRPHGFCLVHLHAPVPRFRIHFHVCFTLRVGTALWSCKVKGSRVSWVHTFCQVEQALSCWIFPDHLCLMTNAIEGWGKMVTEIAWTELRGLDLMHKMAWLVLTAVQFHMQRLSDIYGGYIIHIYLQLSI